MKKFSVNVNCVPSDLVRENPQVGDVYKKDGGPAGFMLIVASVGETHYYIAFDKSGAITGCSQGNTYYFSRRRRVGVVEDLGPIDVIWEPT
jgi:hypothetical protein